jgi:lipid-A-disaccharide synthase
VKLFVTAGEPSGDRLGAALIDGLRQLAGPVEIAGVGGPLLAEAGLRSLFPMHELSVMGIAEVLPRYLHLKRRIAETADAAANSGADVVVTVDSPDFSFRVAEALQRRSRMRIVHYVAPTVWAWRPGRARRLAGHIDQLLALFPFEPPYFEKVGLRCDFVGHPIVAELPAPEAEIADVRAAIGTGSPRLVVLPGSRESEIRRLAPTFGRVLERVAAVHPGLRVVVPTVPNLEILVCEHIAGWPGRPHVVTRRDARRAALAVADVALTKSGTVSLELAAARTPMVVAHDVHPVSRWIIARMALIDTVTLPNIITETRAVPEFIGRDCRADCIAPALLDVIARPEAQLPVLDRTMDLLGKGGKAPGLRAARAVLDGLSRG